MTMGDDKRDQRLIAKIKVLNEIAWEGRCDSQVIREWLSQFSGRVGSTSVERLQMLFLLSKFVFFGSAEIRELLRALFRDHFKYRIVEGIRMSHSDTTDQIAITRMFRDELRRTRFLPVGNPSESGAHLLYFFRQENHLGKKQFMYAHEIFASGDFSKIRDDSIRRYVFLDDLCGSGVQGTQYLVDVVRPLKRADSRAKAIYYVLFGTANGLKAVRDAGIFDEVACVVELDDSFKAFSETSRFYGLDEELGDKDLAKRIAKSYGERLWTDHPLGYRDGQLLLGFGHNVPDNTLPIFWFDEHAGPPWYPVFPRYSKRYGWGQDE